MKILVMMLLGVFLNFNNSVEYVNTKYYSFEMPMNWKVSTDNYNQDMGFENTIIEETNLDYKDMNTINIMGFGVDDNKTLQKSDAIALVNSIKNADKSSGLYKDYVVSYPKQLTSFGSYDAYEFVLSFKFYRENVGYISCSGSVIVIKNKYTVVSLMNKYSNNKTISHFKALNFLSSKLIVK